MNPVSFRSHYVFNPALSEAIKNRFSEEFNVPDPRSPYIINDDCKTDLIGRERKKLHAFTSIFSENDLIVELFLRRLNTELPDKQKIDLERVNEEKITTKEYFTRKYGSEEWADMIIEDVRSMQ